jgi:hypothetical protein
MKIITVRRLDSRVRLLQYAAMLAALFAAAGITAGLHGGDPASGWFLPTFAGIICAVVLAAYWHHAIDAFVGVANPLRIAGWFVASLVVTALALSYSAQGIAQAVSGHAALVRELENRIAGYSTALDEAYVKGTAWSPIIDVALQTASAYDYLMKDEQAGQHGTGKGCGSLCAQDKEFADNFHTGYDRLSDLLNNAKAMRDTGNAALVSLQDAAADGDQKAFLVAGGEVTRAVTDLNGIDPRAIITMTGVINVVRDPSGKLASVSLDGPTKAFHATADKLLGERQFVTPPTFTLISLGEATRAQMFGSALHGWLLAAGIDVMPFIFFFCGFLISREPWMNQMITREKQTREDKAAAESKRSDTLLNPPTEEKPAAKEEPKRRYLDAAE